MAVFLEFSALQFVSLESQRQGKQQRITAKASRPTNIYNSPLKLQQITNCQSGKVTGDRVTLLLKHKKGSISELLHHPVFT